MFIIKIFERLTASLILVILSLLLTIIAVRIGSPGNPIFRQVRVDESGLRFSISQFYTMYKGHSDGKCRALLYEYIHRNYLPLFNKAEI